LQERSTSCSCSGSGRGSGSKDRQDRQDRQDRIGRIGNEGTMEWGEALTEHKQRTPLQRPRSMPRAVSLHSAPRALRRNSKERDRARAAGQQGSRAAGQRVERWSGQRMQRLQCETRTGNGETSNEQRATSRRASRTGRGDAEQRSAEAQEKGGEECGAS
jgi:hypothetical protein